MDAAKIDPLKIAKTLTHSLSSLKFAPPVTHVYNPLEYAAVPFAEYVQRYGRTRKEVMLVGMNPGPYGMVQTGVPFGAVPLVRDWLGIETPVGKPKREHPKRLVQGFECSRVEVSGLRLWGWIQETFGTPDTFFKRFFVYNYCPLAFMEESGKNRTPDKLPPGERNALYAVCDVALRDMVRWLQPRLVVGIGAFAATRAQKALAELGPDIEIGQILHPSPASPLANRGWGPQAAKELQALGVTL